MTCHFSQYLYTHILVLKIINKIINKEIDNETVIFKKIIYNHQVSIKL